MKNLNLKKREKKKKEEEEERKKGGKKETPEKCKNPTQRQRFTTTIKNVTEEKKSSKA